jgi:hypothetical protein
MTTNRLAIVAIAGMCLAFPTQSLAAPPIALDDTVTIVEDTPSDINVLTNDYDPDHDSLTVTVQSYPANGTLEVRTDFQISYTPRPNFNGPDSFTYTANDGTSDSNIAVVHISVSPINDAPTASDDAYSTTRNMALVVDSSSGILVNDVDVEGDEIRVDVARSDSMSAEHGTVTMNADGSFTYIPVLNFSGNDSFEYVVEDSSSAFDNGTVLLNVLIVDSDGDGRADDEDADTIAMVVGDPAVIPDSAFASAGSGHRTAMVALLRGIEEHIAGGRIAQAIDRLESLRERVDGCDGTAAESADGNDWITDCDEQRLVRNLIDILIARLVSE